jgi:hypothetical protein
MITLKQNTIQILNTFDKGQGSTNNINVKLLASGLTVDYLEGGYTFNFQNEAHKDAYLTMLLYKELKDKSADYIDRLFNHLGSGEYLSLNHTKENSKASIDKYSKYKILFDRIGVIEVRSNGKGSKLTQLLCEPTAELITILTKEGFDNISPLLDGFTVIGLKCELPKIRE